MNQCLSCREAFPFPMSTLLCYPCSVKALGEEKPPSLNSEFRLGDLVRYTDPKTNQSYVMVVEPNQFSYSLYDYQDDLGSYTRVRFSHVPKYQLQHATPEEKRIKHFWNETYPNPSLSK